MSQDAKGFFRENGWKFYWIEGYEKPKPRPTHWRYGASQLMIPSLKADLHDKTVEVQV